MVWRLILEHEFPLPPTLPPVVSKGEDHDKENRPDRDGPGGVNHTESDQGCPHRREHREGEDRDDRRVCEVTLSR